ncbi:hypothetical protein [aff. Roholtiella sp. LEGE 12411]|nr:hypothetical protein [aff. Roholtiella sp. LEGE 12411]MBE9034913.1 hypothetical protein [aff. Roholtiella sp. LEGE 12411]
MSSLRDQGERRAAPKLQLVDIYRLLPQMVIFTPSKPLPIEHLYRSMS